jgi:TRAP-type C4-dicarboxylate transport system substrate-binding protein
MEELRRLTRKENTQAIEAMKKRGLKVSAPPAATDLAAMRRAGQKAEKAVQGKLIPADLLTRARRVLAALRSGK